MNKDFKKYKTKIKQDLSPHIAGLCAGGISYILNIFYGYTLYLFPFIFCCIFGALGSILVTVLENINLNTKKFSHSFISITIFLAITHISYNIYIDSFCFGYIFHLLQDLRNKKRLL